VLGVDADDSLYWITYSTQPSKILPSTDATVDAIKKQAINENYKKLLKEFHSDLINPKKKVATTLKKLEKEKDKINKLSKNIEKTIWKDIRSKFADDFKELSRQEKAEKKLKAILFTQAFIRGYLQRKRYKKMKQEQRLYSAVYQVLLEMDSIANENKYPSSGTNQVPKIVGHPSSLMLLPPVPSSAPPNLRSAPAAVGGVQSSPYHERVLSEIARITSSAMNTPAVNHHGVTSSRELPPRIPSSSSSVSVLKNPLVSRSLDYSSTTVKKKDVSFQQDSSFHHQQAQQSVSLTPLKFDALIVNTPFQSHINLPLSGSSPSQQPIDNSHIYQNYNQNDKTYSVRRVEDPVNVQYSARSTGDSSSGTVNNQILPHQPYGSSGAAGGGGSRGGSGYDTPILQTPRGMFSNPSSEQKITHQDQQQQQQPQHRYENKIPPSTPPTNKSGSERKKSNGREGKDNDTPVKQIDSSPALLSPFLDMNEGRDEEGNLTTSGYISSPSQTSLSRSLSVSFGHVSEGKEDPSSTMKRRGKHSSTAVMKSTIPFIHDDMLSVFLEIENKYERNALSLASIIDSALVSDISNFDKVRPSRFFTLFSFLLSLVFLPCLLSV
jgi:hypothetical protein